MEDQHYLHRIDTISKIYYEIKYTVNYISDQLRRYIIEFYIFYVIFT